VFLNTNIWLATGFALLQLTAVFALLFLLALLEPASRTSATPDKRRAASVPSAPGASASRR
jgi:hypothetical protein